MLRDPVGLVPRDRSPPNGGPGDAVEPADDRVVEPLRILVVDDDEAVCEMLSLVLGDEGYEVLTACHGLEAINIIRDGGQPDLVILDLMMPVMSGWAVWDELQANASLNQIPVVIFTATGLRQGSVGHATVLSKTTDADVLLTTIARLLPLG